MQTAQDTVVLPRIEYENLLTDLASYKHQLEELRRLVFGVKSERFIASENPNQLSLFDGEQLTEKADEPTQSITYQRKQKKENKQQPIRALLPAHLPRQEEIIEPEGLTQEAKKIGEEITEILEHIPGKLFVRRIIRPKYVQNESQGVKIAELPSLPIPKGNAGPGLLAYLQVSKFVDHLPFYRQIQMFKREKIEIAESTLNNWFKASCNLLEPLYDELVKQTKVQSYIQADESPIDVLSKNKPGSTHTGYYWVYHAPLEKMAVFDYRPSRSGEGVRDFLSHFKGTLQTDGYAGYDQLSKDKDIVHLSCMAHARRYFEKALDNDRQTAEYALKTIQSLYAIERKAKTEGFTNPQIQKLRQQEALPILHTWKTWLDNQQQKTTPKSPIGKAVNYTLGLWSRFIRYVENGDWEIDNNLIENLIRPLALGRKNYLFAGSHNGAKRAAMMYSFFATCKLNEVNPHSWLKDVLEKIPDTKISQLNHLLPQNWKPITSP